VSWAMQRVAAAGFLPHGTPDLVRATVLEKCGFQPRGDNTQVRHRAYAWSIVLSTVLLCRQPPPSCDCVAMMLTALQPWRRGSMCIGGQGLRSPQAALSSTDWCSH
jgi:hypothetical protein